MTFNRGKKVVFYFEDSLVEAYEGESIAIALYAIGIDVFSWSRRLNRPRGPFCMIGKCSSCFMIVNHVPNSRTCRFPVRNGLRVVRQKGLSAPSLVESTDENVEQEELNPDVLIIGGGPAGLEAALVLSKYDLDILIVDEHYKLGGQLLKQTHKFFGNVELFGGLRGFQIAEEYVKKLSSRPNIKMLTNTSVYGVFRDGIVGALGLDKNYIIRPRAVIASTGAQERLLEFPNNDLPGVIGAGGAQTIMNEFGVKPGDKALVIGSGNVGLIVSYQLLQAGVDVKGVVEILDEIGGWFVHAAKIRRYGIPIYTRHTLKYVEGDYKVRKAVISAVDERFNFIHGTEKEFDVDLVLLAIGLEPDSRIHIQAGCVAKYVPELGGIVPIRTRDLETSVPNLYVAGDASGIEEATTAILEGRVAGLSIATKLCEKNNVESHYSDIEKILKFLWEEYRMSPLLQRARRGKESVTVSREELEELRRKYPPL
ncbi:MAG: FAD-dependent oxidoreductase, partial [Desulfurococcaceae archaeon]